MNQHELLQYAVKNHRRVAFTYQSSTDGQPLHREVDGWIYGSRNSKKTLLGMEVREGVASIKRFNLDKASGVKLLKHNETEIPATNRPDKAADGNLWDEVYAEW